MASKRMSSGGTENQNQCDFLNKDSHPTHGDSASGDTMPHNTFIAPEEGDLLTSNNLYKVETEDKNSPKPPDDIGKSSDVDTTFENKRDRLTSPVNYVSSSLEGISNSIPMPKILFSKEPVHKCHSDPTQKKRPKSSTQRFFQPPLSPTTNHQRKKRAPVTKCTLKLDGYSYMIVASAPEKSVNRQRSTACQETKNGQLAKQGSLTILRRSSSKTFSGRRQTPSDDEFLDAVDLDCENLPSTDTPEAAEKAALRLRVLLRRLRQGEINASALQKNLQYAAEVLETGIFDDMKHPIGDERPVQGAITIDLCEDSKRFRRPRKPGLARNRRRTGDEEDELSEVEPDAVPPEVREWLASTFTKQLQGGRRKNEEKPKFRSVANAIRAGIFVERIYRRLSTATYQQLSPEVTSALKRVDEWSFDVWALQEVSSNTPLRCLAYEFLNRYGLLNKFKIPPASLEGFLQKLELGYCKFKNPYHNNVHAADVLQTIHYMLSQTGLMNWLSDVEIFATLVAALIHDFEHTGTTNNYHVMSGSDTALLYNDRAVLENHHISSAFRLLKDEGINILVNFSREEFKEFRTLVIDMVLATDMSFHFQHIKSMKTLLTLPDPTLDKSKALSLVLHCCDISHPSKMWRIHEKWTSRLLEEFFRQGDMEKEMGLPYSPLCDRNNTLVAESQIGFIEFIVEPSLAVCGDLLQKIASLNSAGNGNSTIKEEPETGGDTTKKPSRVGQEIKRPWEKILVINKGKWRERATKDAAERAARERLYEEIEEEEEYFTENDGKDETKPVSLET